jgi:hypothetical protein
MKTIRFTYQREVTLDPLWFDEQWLEENVAEGVSIDEALRLQIKLGYEEDWSSLLEEMTAGSGSRAQEFVDSVTSIEVVEVGSGDAGT